MADLIPPSEALGNAVWLRRERELGLSRDTLAERLGWQPANDGRRTRSGWSPRTLVRLEKGLRGIRDHAELNALAASLELTAGALEVRVSTPKPQSRSEDPYGFAAAIEQVPDPDARAVLLRIADDLTDLARRLTGDEDHPGD